MMYRHRQATFRSEFIAPRQGCLPLPDHRVCTRVCVCVLRSVVVVKATRAQSHLGTLRHRQLAKPPPLLRTTSPAPTPIPFGLALIDVIFAVASDFAQFVQPSAASWSNSRCVSVCVCTWLGEGGCLRGRGRKQSNSP